MNSKTCAYAFCTLFSIVFIFQSAAANPDWSSRASLPGSPYCEWHEGHEVCLTDQTRANIYHLGPSELKAAVYEGAKHALVYPVEVTQLLMPEESIQKFFNEDSRSPLRRMIYRAAQALANFQSMNEVFRWLGLHDYPRGQEQLGPNPIPYMGRAIESRPMGVTHMDFHGAPATTFSCAACHTSDLFGVKVLGLTNRFPRANEFFATGKKLIKNTPALAYQAAFGPSKQDMQLFKQAKKALKHVEVVKPLALGLDTSLAQVGLSLSRRGDDEYAQRIPFRARFPKANLLRTKPADSKPAVWWNLKYKTRWLSDGSIVSGNPIHTNLLWNEIGRGVDLEELEQWLLDNQDTIGELTAHVFNAKAPRYNDFFPMKINIDRAKRGERLFLNNCASCHGKYEKGWSSGARLYEDQIATTKVWYHKQTPVIDVGTDPHRYEGMRYFYQDLNRLKISKTIGTVVKPQVGYVPPPLEGIWSRWPYFHNNSAPTLYAVLTPDFNRPKFYISTPAIDKDLDFDQVKNGYPEPELVRMPYRKDKEYFFDATKPGMSNQGHTEMMLTEDGREKFSHEEKLELIEFLKTL